MHTTLAATLTSGVLLLVAGCDDATSGASGSSPSAPTQTTVADPEVDPALNGTYRARITPKAFRAAVMADGWKQKTADRILAVDHPADPEFLLDLHDGRFRMSLVATDEQWQSGTYETSDGKFVLDDEAPFGTMTLAYTVSDSRVRFTYLTNDAPEGVEFAPGIPDYLPGVGYWAAVPWQRVRSAPSRAPVASPFAGDDAWIAYQSFRDGSEGLWLVHPDGSGDHPLDTGLPVVGQLPDWSPDGSRLVFTTRGGATEPLYEYAMRTGRSTQLFDCTDPCLGDDEPVYSPDGTEVLFVRATGPFLPNDGPPSDCGLWVGDRETHEVRRLTSNAACDREISPRWSPDGSRLTYHRDVTGADGTLRTAVYVADADGTHEQRLTDPALVAGDPDWSPDGDWIVFSTYPLNEFQSDGDSQLWRMHPDGTGLEQLTHFRGVRATQPRYTPDGEWIVLTAVRPARRSLWAIPADGGKPVVIADRERIYTHGVWQPGTE